MVRNEKFLRCVFSSSLFIKVTKFEYRELRTNWQFVEKWTNVWVILDGKSTTEGNSKIKFSVCNAQRKVKEQKLKGKRAEARATGYGI